MPVARLSDRGIVSVNGPDAATLLQGLVTCDIDHLQPGGASLASLLTPQGKILFEFLIVRAPDTGDGAVVLPGLEEGGFLLDVHAESAAALAKRLNFYKLRAKVVVSDRSADLAVAVRWNDDVDAASEQPLPDPLPGLVFTDPRLAALGQRAITPANDIDATIQGLATEQSSQDAWRAHRIALAVPEGGSDYAFGEAFPHEADLDQLGGVAFDKGCYVGQEVVSRMHHRGTARTRMVAARLPEGSAAAQGDDVMAGEKRIGDIRARAGQHAIALVRIDRIADALADGAPITVLGAPVALTRPAWATFDMIAS